MKHADASSVEQHLRVCATGRHDWLEVGRRRACHWCGRTEELVEVELRDSWTRLLKGGGKTRRWRRVRGGCAWEVLGT